MVSPRTSIFVSHVNGDPDAEPVLQALIDKLRQELAPTHDAYEIAYDREIIAGTEWRSTIYTWLVDCAAAIFLISKGAFDPQKPWVRRRRAGSQGQLPLEPLEGEQQLPLLDADQVADLLQGGGVGGLQLEDERDAALVGSGELAQPAAKAADRDGAERQGGAVGARPTAAGAV